MHLIYELGSAEVKSGIVFVINVTYRHVFAFWNRVSFVE
jgi:hypothetical protein